MTGQVQPTELRRGPENHGRDRLAVAGLNVNVVGSGAKVVEGFSLTLRPGEILAVVGESGSGKSTAALGLLGWTRAGLRITSGSVEIDGESILDMGPARLRSARGRLISYVPQDPTSGLNPAVRVGAQLREALTNHPEAFAAEKVDVRVMEMLEEVGLPADEQTLRSFPHQLSGGQQQRVAIAMAFACRPAVVVLDEPTTGLDVTTQRRVLDTVRELASRYGSSAIYVSHDLAVVANIADYTAVVYAGRVVEFGPTARIFRAPGHRYTHRLLLAVPDVDASRQLVGIPGSPPRPGSWPQGCAFASRCEAVTDACQAQPPEQIPLGESHWARCIHPVKASTQIAAPLIDRPDEEHPVAVLTARGVKASFGRKTVLHGVDLDVRAAECTAIVGESGSGKTTIARCLVGLNETWDGQIEFEGSRLMPVVRSRTREQRRRIQYIFQNPYSSLNPRSTVGQNLDEPVRYFFDETRSQRRERVLRVLDEVALNGSYIDRMPTQLSGGERQRVAIARALVVDPDVLVCDEVTSALDVSVQAMIVEHLRGLQMSRGLSLVFITHNLAVVRSIAQHVVVVAGGRVVESGRTDMVLDQPSHAYTQRLMADLPRLPDARNAEDAS